MKIKEKKTRLVKLMFTQSKFDEIQAKAAEKGLTLKQYILRSYIQE